MTTSTGAIYTTTNAGGRRNWKAEVKESIDATLNRVSSSGVSGASYYSGSVGNIKRAADGSVPVCSIARQLLPDLEARGRLLAAPQPRDAAPHHGHGLRVGNNAQNGVWMTLNGGQMALAGASANTDVEPAFSGVSIDSGGYGILDCDYRTPQEAWAVGGGGTMYRSVDGGKSSFKFDASARPASWWATCTRSSSSTTRPGSRLTRWRADALRPVRSGIKAPETDSIS